MEFSASAKTSLRSTRWSSTRSPSSPLPWRCSSCSRVACTCRWSSRRHRDGGLQPARRTPAKVRDTVSALGYPDVQVQNFGTSRDVMIRLPVQRA